MALTERDEKGRSKPAGIALWWIVGGELVGAEYAIRGPDAVLDPSGRYLEPKRGHEEAWREHRPQGADASCDELPRGTVAFDCMLHKFIVRGPGELVEDDAFREAVREHFGLPPIVIYKAAV